MTKKAGAYYQLENGREQWFKCLGSALQYCHKHKTRIVRKLSEA